MSLFFIPPQPTCKLAYRVSGRIEAVANGGFRVLCFGTSWRFKVLVCPGRVVQLYPGQVVTVVGLDDATTLLVECS
ncbi:MAG: hypothetical protein KME12_25995 [Trichocoleus desertorum ATA4-8-CV12]|nr:hypothetical protein [Trichocoleus desertorum ATA4-8-CV12]